MNNLETLTAELERREFAELILSFAEIESIIGGPLPDSARRPQYWENPSDPKYVVGMKRAVREAGYHSFLLRGQDKVRFVRVMP